jgi:hypothetical protein
MRLFLRAIILTLLLLSVGVAFEASHARAGDGFSRYLAQQAHFQAQAQARKSNTVRPAVKTATPTRKTAPLPSSQRPTGRSPASPLMKAAPR